MTDLNCPNCGAPIRSVECPYCGTVFYDFACIRDDNPSYIRIKVNDHYLACRAMMQSTTLNMQPDALPEVDISFVIFPDDKGVYLEARKEEQDERR